MRAYSGFRLRSRFGRKSSRAGIEESTTPTNGNGAADRTYTWQEVAAHNTAKSVWVTVRGKVYDITGMDGQTNIYMCMHVLGFDDAVDVYM